MSQSSGQTIDKLLGLDTESQVEQFLQTLMQEEGFEWAPLGGDLDPAGLIGAQPDPVKAIIERIVNMHDATIEKFKPANDSESEPDTPREAVARWMNLSKDLSKEDDDKLRELGRQNKIQFVLTSRKGSPTVKFRDFASGCVDATGQLNLRTTILSLLHRNKASKKYVAGLFGFGGSTTLWHCKYCIVVSRPQQMTRVKDIIGWTVVRRRPPQGSEKRDQFEYVALPNSDCPYTDGTEVSIDDFPAGTFVAQIEYNLRTVVGTSDLIVTGPDMLYQQMRYLLFNPVLPFWLEAVGSDHKPLKTTQARNISGNLRILNKAWELDKTRKLEGRQQVLLHGKYSNKDGLVIRYWVFNVRKGENQAGGDTDEGTGPDKQPNPFISRYLETWHKRKANPIVLTINGQTHYEFPVSIFRQFGLQLLENYLLVQIDLDEMHWGARRDIFNKIASTRYDLKQDLQETLIDELSKALGKSNQQLWAIVDFLVERILSQTVEDTRIDKLLRRIILNYESRKAGQGDKVLGVGAIPTTGNTGTPEYRPNFVPSRFEFDEYPDPLELGIGSKKIVRILTDAPDDVTDRDTDRGFVEAIMPGDSPITTILSKPSNGVILLSLLTPEDLKSGFSTTLKAKLAIRQSGVDSVGLETETLNLVAVDVEQPEYLSVDPPTKLRIVSQSDPIKLKRGRTTSVALEYDGSDDLFERDSNKGELVGFCSIDGVDASSGNLAPHNGRITRFVNVPDSTSNGTEGTITFRLSVLDTLLEASRKCVVVEPTHRIKRFGEPYSDEMSANFEARWVHENDNNWTRLGFTPSHVARAESLPDGKLMVWVNWDNARLRRFYKFRRERVNEGEAKLDAERFRMQVAYYAYQRNKQGLIDNDDENTQNEYLRVAETTMIGLLPLNQIALF